MNNTVLMVVICFLLGIVAFQFWRSRREVGERESSSKEIIACEEEDELPLEIVIVDEKASNPEEPVITIRQRPLGSHDYQNAVPIEGSGVERFSSLLQAAPSILVAGEAQGKQLMEVVMKGDLVSAADGNGLRAMARGASGINEHGRLFEVGKLKTLIKATAIWSAVSVLVAQKHLADISAKLDDIKKGVSDIADFLNNQRYSRIQGTYDYLCQVAEAIRGGELSGSVRTELESCERDLLGIQNHLIAEIKQKAAEEAKGEDWVGSKDLTNNISKKITEMDPALQALVMCFKTRAAAWHVFSLYPGELGMKEGRRRSIEEGLDELLELKDFVHDAVKDDISNVQAFWNLESTLKERKNTLAGELKHILKNFKAETEVCTTGLENSAERLRQDAQPQKIFVEIEDGVVVGARQAR